MPSIILPYNLQEDGFDVSQHELDVNSSLYRGLVACALPIPTVGVHGLAIDGTWNITAPSGIGGIRNFAGDGPAWVCLSDFTNEFRLDISQSVLTAAPISLAYVGYITATSGTSIVQVENSASILTRDRVLIGLSGSNAYWRIAAASSSGLTGANSNKLHTYGLTATVGVYSSATSYFCANDGCLGALGTTSRIPSGMNRIVVGSKNTNGISNAMKAALWWNRALEVGEALEFSKDPRVLFKPLRPRILFFTASSATQAALTGSSVTATAGTIAPAVTYALSGASATATAGTITSAITQALTGVPLTASAGTVYPALAQAITGESATASASALKSALTVPLVGEQATTAAGTVSTSSATSAALTGTSATANAGAVASALTYSLIGASVATATGTVSASWDTSTALTGAAVTATAGTVASAVTVPLTGTSATATAGTVVTSNDISVALTGASATTTAGNTTVSTSVALSGQSITTDAGVATNAVTVALSGAGITATAGSIGIGSFTPAQLAEILAYIEANLMIWDDPMEGTLTFREAMRIMLAALAGKRAGLGTATEEYMAQDGVTPRVTFTPSDAAGNGTTVVDGA